MGDTALLSAPEPAWAASYILPPEPGIWELWFDGLCEPVNPGGVMCWAWILKDRKGLLASFAAHCPRLKGNTNNVSEWYGLGTGLTRVVDLLRSGREFEKMVIRGDSNLVINQLIGTYACKADHLRILRDKCRVLLNGNSIKWTAEWIPREKNEEADQLCRDAYVSLTGQQPPVRGRAGAR